jgi:hypothetical protein
MLFFIDPDNLHTTIKSDYLSVAFINIIKISFIFISHDSINTLDFLIFILDFTA